MYRITRLGRRWYAIQIDSVADDLENIEEFTNEGGVVLLVESLEDAEDFIDEEIITVERE